MEYDYTITKLCTCCNLEKVKFRDFELVKDSQGIKRYVRPQCRECRNKNEIQRRNKSVETREQWLQYQKKWREENTDKIKQHYIDNKETINQKCKEYRDINKAKISVMKSNYNEKDVNKQRRNAKDRTRKLIDEQFRISANIRTRIHNVLKQNKMTTSDALLGCTKQQLMHWLTYQLRDGFNWENYADKWQIDHVIPLAFFDLNNEQEQMLAFNWSNLRPLDKIVNLSKNDKIIKLDIIEHMKQIDNFLALNDGYQTNVETCWRRRVDLRYGKNSQYEENFEDFLKWAIRSQAT